MTEETDPLPFNRRQYMMMLLATKGANFFESLEAVESAILDHPSWDLAEENTWAGWENQNAEK